MNTLDSCVKVAVCVALAEWGVSMLLARSLAADQSMVQKVASNRTRDPMANVLFTGLIGFVGCFLASTALRAVKMSSGPGGPGGAAGAGAGGA